MILFGNAMIYFGLNIGGIYFVGKDIEERGNNGIWIMIKYDLYWTEVWWGGFYSWEEIKELIIIREWGCKI